MKYKFNKDKLLRNVAIIGTIISAGILVYKVATQGISFMSTIGYFG